MSHKKFGPDRFSRFDVYWIQTNKQTDRQAKFIYRFIALFSFLDLILKKSVADQTIFRTVGFLVLKSYNDSLAF